MTWKYMIQIGDGEKREVTEKEFIEIEKSLGFVGYSHEETPPKPSTAAFGKDGTHGWMEWHEQED